MPNPFAGTPDEANWSKGFIAGFTDPSVPVPEVQSPEAPDPFTEGRRVGRSLAVGGLSFEPSCVDVSEEHHGDLHLHLNNAHLIEIGLEGTLAHAGCSAVVALLLLAITLPVHYREPEEVLAPATERLAVLLTEMGVPSLELFLGAGLDYESPGCQLKLTPVYQWEQAAREAAEGMGRAQWFVLSWRSDASGFLTVVSSSA